MTATTHPVRVEKLSTRHPQPWMARCGGCEWIGRSDTREAAISGAERHQELVGDVPEAVGEKR